MLLRNLGIDKCTQNLWRIMKHSMAGRFLEYPTSLVDKLLLKFSMLRLLWFYLAWLLSLTDSTLYFSLSKTYQYLHDALAFWVNLGNWNMWVDKFWLCGRTENGGRTIECSTNRCSEKSCWRNRKREETFPVFFAQNSLNIQKITKKIITRPRDKFTPTSGIFQKFSE